MANTAARPLDGLGTVRSAQPQPLPLRDLARRFIAFDDELATHGVPPLTVWWREGLARWLDAYEHHNVLELVACVGRGAAKSTAMVKLACFFAHELDAAFPVPPGERHYAGILSLRKKEARKGLVLAEHIFAALGVACSRHDDVVDILGSRKGVLVVAASVQGATGWRCFFLAKDERSKWAQSEMTERDADEVDTSAAAMTATHELAPLLSFGSAWTAAGEFYDAVRAGSTDTRVVLGPAATWVAAPHVTEASTRRKERNAAKWRREYASEFQEGTDEGLFTASMLDAVTRATAHANDARPYCYVVPAEAPDGRRWLPREPEDIPREPGVTYVAAQDVAFVRNAWTFAIAGQRRVGKRVVRSVVLTREWQGSADAPLKAEAVLAEIAGYCRAYGVTVVESDKYERFALGEIARRPDIRLFLNVYDHGQLAPRYEALLTQITDGEVELPANPVLRRDLLAVQQRFTSRGHTIHLPVTSDGRHCDFAPTVQLAIAACVTSPDERALLTPDERVEQAALQMDLDSFAPKKRNRAEPWYQRDPIARAAGYSPLHERGRKRR